MRCDQTEIKCGAYCTKKLANIGLACSLRLICYVPRMSYRMSPSLFFLIGGRVGFSFCPESLAYLVILLELEKCPPESELQLSLSVLARNLCAADTQPDRVTLPEISHFRGYRPPPPKCCLVLVHKVPAECEFLWFLA